MRRSHSLFLTAALALCVAATVSVKDLKFTPATVTIEAGQAVTWTNTDTRDYTVTEKKKGGFDSGPLKPGKSYKQTFTTTGTYEYGSKLHPRMKGRVIVK